jgi:hypothetical protein
MNGEWGGIREKRDTVYMKIRSWNSSGETVGETTRNLRKENRFAGEIRNG